MTRVQHEIEIITAFLTTRAVTRAQEADDFAARLADAEAALARRDIITPPAPPMEPQH